MRTRIERPVAWPRLWAAMFLPIADAPHRNTGQASSMDPAHDAASRVYTCSGLFNFTAALKRLNRARRCGMPVSTSSGRACRTDGPTRSHDDVDDGESHCRSTAERSNDPAWRLVSRRQISRAVRPRPAQADPRTGDVPNCAGRRPGPAARDWEKPLFRAAGPLLRCPEPSKSPPAARLRPLENALQCAVGWI